MQAGNRNPQNDARLNDGMHQSLNTIKRVDPSGSLYEMNVTFDYYNDHGYSVCCKIMEEDMCDKVIFRYAERKDTALILQFIKDLADYEKMSDEVVADEKNLEEWIFDKNKAEVMFAMADGKEVGFALFFHNFSTFLGRAGIYLEDLYVKPEYRGKGYGKAILHKLASIAVERKCGRLEWWCLDWNKPSIDFYLSLGAEPMSDWTVYRITGETLTAMASKEL